MGRITNAVLLEKILSVHDRLDELNGQTYKNTKHRHMQVIINAVLGTVGSATVIGIITIAVDSLISK